MHRYVHSIPKQIMQIARWSAAIFLVGFIGYQFFSVIFPNISSFTHPYYTDAVYKNLEDTFNRSQYRIKNPTAIIPDETVYSYAAGAYLHGVDPIIVNSERAPLGKYILSLSILLFQNDKLPVIFFGIATLLLLWVLSAQILGNALLALLPVALLCMDRLFLDQLRYVPLLDIIHLPFILLTFVLFIRERPRAIFYGTAVSLGFVIATKTIYTGVLLIIVFFLYQIIQKQYYNIGKLILYLPISVMVLLASYTKTFLNGYTLLDFIGFQKWILLYDKSKLIYPFSIWRLVFFNEWQTWWGDMTILRAEDWTLVWPVVSIISIIGIFLALARKFPRQHPIGIMLLWIVVYGGYMSLGIASSRFLLLLLPVQYIVGVYVLRYIYAYVYKDK